MTLTDLETLIGSLTNDPSHERYLTTDIGIELDNSMDKWNVEAKIIKSTTTITVVAATRQYALSGITGTVISIPRATHKGLDLTKKDKSYLDLYTGNDWTLDNGTPQFFVIEQSDPTIQMITLYPNPTGNDAGANLVVEAIIRHTSMSAASDVPFMSGTNSNAILRPYDWGLAYLTAARLLARDPTNENLARVQAYAKVADGVMADVVQVFKALERQEPMRVRVVHRPIRGIYA